VENKIVEQVQGLEPKPRARKHEWHRLDAIAYQNIIILGVLLIVSMGMALTSNRFLSMSNFSNIIVQASLVIIAGSAVTLIIISGNLDLSVGGIMAMGGVLYALFSQAGIPTFPWAALLAVLIAGSAMGVLNGVLITRLKIPSFIATLSVMYITKGIAYIGAKGTTIVFGLPIDFSFIGNKMLGPLPLPIVYTLVIIAIFIFVQTKTRLGKETFAIGSNPRAAALSGIHSKRVVTALYIMAGTLAAFSGVIFTARVGVGDCTIGTGFEFDVFTAVVLGGTNISGGKGSIIGMVLGALLLRVLTNGLNLVGIQSYYQSIISGVVLVLAILLNRFIVAKSTKVIEA
jgi:ribose/xylose/arabinose/galactoside ABC-type transport system permease subunit